jgi:glycosyltransferase involved in cell wall biosynthesis
MQSNFARKNPLAAVEAFDRAFGDTARVQLVLRCLDVESYADGHLKRAITERGSIRLCTRPTITPFDLVVAADTMLSLHRSEGFGLTLLEAMAAFMSRADSFLVDFSLIPVHNPQGVYMIAEARWAEPNIDAAAGKLRRLYDQPILRNEISENARSRAAQLAAKSEHPSALEAALTSRRPHFRLS